MIKVDQVKVPVFTSREGIIRKAAKMIQEKPGNITHMEILRHSIDARKKELMDVYQIVLSLSNEERFLEKIKTRPIANVTEYKEVKYNFYSRREEGTLPVMEKRPVIVGAGPAGYFCGLMLSKHGYRPIIIERGKPVEERKEDVDAFWKTGALKPQSNVQFGEGGAGAFSDGKLNTLVKDKEGRSRKVLQTFVEYGADERILTDQKPHVGTDYLYRVLQKMRQDFLAAGGEIRFETVLTGLEVKNSELTGIVVNDVERIDTDVCVLAIGHSARDTFTMLYKDGVAMEPKSFAVGFRVEHPQDMVNRLQYGADYEKELPAAAYKVTAKTTSGRGVYSFCMCPGGYVVNASSEPEKLAVNGMSYFARDGKNANSAMIVAVTPEDYPDKTPLGGVHFQQELEKKAYACGKGAIPQQLFGDFEENKKSTAYGAFESETKGVHTFANLRGILPKQAEEAFMEGMHSIGRKVKGFDRADAILSGIESRTSSPVRIMRNEEMESNIKGLYPCGEGAGYAGGIMSAAMDGMKIAEQIAARYLPWNENNGD
ncbi:MAG: FAD-dependent oxidoreductase [Lachnospiraceae bacterium]|nr:FAD-dependent oxidoreductase [Lachnospiraceae bacterium]